MPEQPSILVVDDNHDAADLLGAALRTVGYRVAIIHTSVDALARIDDLRPAAAILDIGLPEIDGYQLARELRLRQPAIKLIAVTGYGQAADRERALAAGFDEHFVKPASLGDLFATLERLLGGNTPSKQ